MVWKSSHVNCWRYFIIWYWYFSSFCNLLQQDYNNALRELQCQLSKGISLKDLQSNMITSTKTEADNREQFRLTPYTSTKTVDNREQFRHEVPPYASTKRVDNREPFRHEVPPYACKRRDVGKWLQKQSKGCAKSTTVPSSFMDLVGKSMGADNVISRQNYHMGICEIVVSIILIGNFCFTEEK